MGMEGFTGSFGEDEESCVGGEVSCATLMSSTCTSSVAVDVSGGNCLEELTLLVWELGGLLYALE